ncbi:DUF4352 domain-containing protein [Paenibacillus sp. GYB006]|uniref:DUF4352 domain-containing protein n=1 Tax=Paenibacillus sp. GYB006 TaxID=2994394 RepID=UPI002F969413
MKKFLKITAIIFGVLIAIGIIGSMGEDDASTAGDQASNETVTTVIDKNSNSTNETKKEDVKTYQISDTVKTGNLAYKVTNVTATNELKSDNQFIESATTSGQFIVIDLEVSNNDSKTRMIDSSMFKMYDDQNREFEPSSDTEVIMVVEGAMDFFLQDINPGLSKTGQLVFELPSDSSSYTLQVSSGYGWAGGDYESIKLK